MIVLVWIHVISAMFWVGSMLFFSLILMPSLREGISEAQKIALISKIGKKLRKAGWIALIILILTGVLRLSLGGIIFGGALKLKLGLVLLMIVLTLFHDFILGPRSIAESRSGSGKSSFRQTTRWIARLNLLVALAIVYAAVALVRGG